jgi:DNA replication protein DnaC
MSENNRHFDERLKYLKLPFIREHYQGLATQAVEKHLPHIDYLEKLANGKAALRRDRSIQRRIRQAHFPVSKTLDQFKWSWPKKLNRLQVKNLFRLQFIPDKQNVIFLGGVGLGKSHLAVALGYQASLEGHSVLFATAIDVINTLAAAQAAGRPKAELKKTHPHRCAHPR